MIILIICNLVQYCQIKSYSFVVRYITTWLINFKGCHDFGFYVTGWKFKEQNLVTKQYLSNVTTFSALNIFTYRTFKKIINNFWNIITP